MDKGKSNAIRWQNLAAAVLILSGCSGSGEREEALPVFPERHYETELPLPEAFGHYLGDFQRDPRDEKARLSVIDLAGKLDPRPARPPEVEILAGTAVAAIKNAKSPSDFADAAAAFEQALNKAPWIGSFYNNAAVAYEKAGQPERAIQHYSWYLVAAPADPDAPKIRAHMGELQYEANKRAKFRAQIATLQSLTWVHGARNLFGDYFENTLVVQQGKLVLILPKGGRVVWGYVSSSFELDADPEVIRRNWPAVASMKYKFSQDFASVSETTTLNDGKVTESIYYRR
jgi:tetratricopeptide (TPR) repeat protein